MRLLIVSQYFWPENFRINELVGELVARGHEVTVLTGRPNYPDGHVFEDFRRDPRQFSSYAGARVERVPLRPRGRGRMSLALNYCSFVLWGCLLAPWRLRGQRFDAVFFFEISPITAALPAILLSYVKGAPLLMWVLDLWPETLAAVGIVRSTRVLNWVGRLVAYIYRRCDRILVQSQAFVPNVERWSGDATRIRYFPAWAEAVFDDAREGGETAHELAEYDTTFNVMFAGNIGDAQDFPAILVAAQTLAHRADIRWLVVGDGRAAAGFRAEIERLGLQDRVIMFGRHPLERMPSFFRGADALLVSLKGEPIFGMTIPGKVQAYLAAGVPVLGMLDGEGARIVAESGAGFVCPAGDGVALAGLVERLSDLDAEARIAMGQRGREYCGREFDRNMLLDKLERWFAETVAECHARNAQSHDCSNPPSPG